jgi:hypothetical protein
MFTEVNFSAEGVGIRMKFAGPGHGVGLRLRRRGEHQNREKQGRLMPSDLAVLYCIC